MTLLMILSIIFFGSGPADLTAAPATSALAKPYACQFFTNENAARILGGSVRCVDNGVSDDENGSTWRCTFSLADGQTANDPQPKLYFALIKSGSEDAAHKLFAEVSESNKGNTGFETWQGDWDEGVVHSDAENFQFVMLRKGARTIRLKVNPAKGTDLENVKAIAARLSRQL